MIPSIRTACAVGLVMAFGMGMVIAENNDQDSAEAEQVANRAIAFLAAWNNTAARKVLESKKGKYGETPQFKTAWALLEIQEGAGNDAKKSEAAEDALSRAAKRSPAEPAALYLEAEHLYAQAKKKEAANEWKAAATRAKAMVDEDPTNATAQFYLGAALTRMKQYGPAREALLIAVRGGFDEAMVNHQIGLGLMFQEKWEEAKAAFDLGLSVQPRYAPFYYWRAMAWDKLGRTDNMLIDLDQFVKLAPHAPEAGTARTILAAAGR